jgi:glycogen synthase
MTADTVGGVWTYAIDLAAGLAQHGVEVVLATMGAPLNAVQRAEANSVSGLEVVESSYRLEWMDDPWSDVDAAGEWLREVSERYCPDLAHLNGYAHAALEWDVPVLVVAHSCVLSWWEAVKRERAPARYSEYGLRVQAGLARADWVVAPSGAMLKEVERLYGRLKRRSVIWNGRRAGVYGPGPKEEMILTAGRLWDEAKNVRAVTRMAELVPWRVYVAGETSHPCGGGENVFSNARLLGRLNAGELAERYARSGIYVLPARYEPFGLSILEAGLSGCALVLGDIPSLRELWEDAALFVAPDDEAMLASVVRELIRYPSLRAEFGRRARRRGIDFTAERMAIGYASVYERLLEEVELGEAPVEGSADDSQHEFAGGPTSSVHGIGTRSLCLEQ